MSIPRRPVVPSKADATASLPTKTEPPTAEAPPPASPTDSIGSLLSAYSRSSAGESIIRSSDGAGSQRYSAVTMSPQEEVRGGRKDGLTPLPSVPQEYEVPRGRLQESSRDLIFGKGLPSQPFVVEEGRKPFPPRKDSVRVPTAGGPTTIMPSSPQRDQLWRRRSGKHGNKFIVTRLARKLTFTRPCTRACTCTGTGTRTRGRR
ncbi:hypothetical protein VdG1_06229 [Verticillium dahliae VDG1]|nr:hypothetical protein VdG1_06229 [Verticillium dahliae VDG1]